MTRRQRVSFLLLWLKAVIESVASKNFNFMKLQTGQHQVLAQLPMAEFGLDSPVWFPPENQACAIGFEIDRRGLGSP